MQIYYFTTSGTILFLFAFLIKGLTLDGGSDGAKFYFSSDFSKLSFSAAWKEAASQMFYTLGIVDGGFITLSQSNR